MHGTWPTHRPSDAGEQAVLPGKPSESSGWAPVFRAQKKRTLLILLFSVCILMWYQYEVVPHLIAGSPKSASAYLLASRIRKVYECLNVESNNNSLSLFFFL